MTDSSLLPRYRFASISSLWLLSLVLLVVARVAGFHCPVPFRRTITRSSSTQRLEVLTVRGTNGNAITTRTNNNNEVVDVCICGAGPAGLLLASRLACRGCSVHVVDPALELPWPNNYGVWMDEACWFGYEDCIDHVWKQVGIVYDEDTPEQILTRPYGRIDRKAMKARLIRECNEAPGQVTFTAAKAVDLCHFDNGPSQVTLRQLNSNDNSDSKDIVQALLVLDATGFVRQFVRHNVEFDPGYQVTYGARFRVKDLGPYCLERMVLMDYSEQHLANDRELVKSNARFPSFLYAQPLAKDELFLEETILVSRPGGSSRNLQARLEKRMQALNITSLEILEEERAAIPMGGADPVVPQRTIGFGATSSLVHPASGYMVARAMEVAPRVAQQMVPHVQKLRKLRLEGTLTKQALEEASADIWQTVIWPVDERRQRDFMHFGFELLCKLNPQELRDFFTGFFRLPDGLWEHFLSWRLSGIGHVYMGLLVWATCIPRRFMPSMLFNSIPFLPDKLVFPFATRGNPLYTESVYWDAQSNNSTLWEPESFFGYIDRLVKRSYPGKERLQVQDEISSPEYTTQKDTATQEDRVQEPVC